ncbi:DUF881 domain-containing protein [Serpentinicella alkaliphila]|uniref:Uncharacterized protein YlxW (UPF0749 family) n=2 Tax=Serpentinicella alkaliphila TaxID=1734049 RepID=A0A4V2T3X5_9FIRM|nr:DUF881 domain-containing protein [Serpentinicella alkaliphila]TCQ03064.1 uncharacterized protein YlxW (UPF0749 family) [Serpentinicella alkaliphila]
MNNIRMHIIILLSFIIVGVALVLQLEQDFNVPDEPGSPLNRIQDQEIIDLRKVNEDMRTRIVQLRQQVDEYEEESSSENLILSNLKAQVRGYRLIAGNVNVKGPGVIITIEGSTDDNIAYIVEQRRYLLNLVNELKVFGAEVISINNHRIINRSDIVLAGNHINVNATPIAPPYVIRVIGDTQNLRRYIDYRTVLFELMQRDNINYDIKFTDDVEIQPITREKSIQFLQIAEEN